MVNFYKRMSKKLSQARRQAEREELKKIKAPEERIDEPALPKSVQVRRMPELYAAPGMPKITEVPKVVVKGLMPKEGAPKLLVPPQQVIIQAPVARPQIIKEQVMEMPEGMEIGSERGFELKYKPISMEMPEEFETAVGEELGRKTKEFVDKLIKVDEKVPLITLKIKGKDIVVSWANIKWNEATRSLIYYIHEPKLNDKLKAILEEARHLLRQKLDIDFTKIRVEKAYEYLMNKFDNILSEVGAKVDSKEKVVLDYYVFRDFIGLGKIESLLHDKGLEDIHCDGFNIPLFVTHRNPLYGEMQTNIMFKDKEKLDSFVLRLAQKCGKALSIAEPLLDGALPDGSRVQITFGTDIAMRGSNFTIRKFTENPITPIDEMNFGTASPEICAYLWMAVESGLSGLIVGATATGKTSFLNSLSMFINPELKIISIEDTPELRLPHPNWIPEVARSGFGIKGYGEVTMFDLLKSALRQRPNYVIVGEVRGKEAYVMFQGMATGHPSYGTLHADNMAAVIDRLTTEPINIPKSMLENLDLIVFLVQTKKRGEYVRRVNEIIEIIGYNAKTRNLVTNRAFKWDSDNDKFVLLKSILLDKIREKLGYTIDELKLDMVRRIRLLKWLQKHNLTDYKEVARYFKMYYTSPEKVEKLVRRAE